ncbi:hypothetical protein L0P88_04145 [Muricauda sp. SCSIO 64092]|uniref:hypothetical protein n=1 Tax=Allomuricauda sp. SCSIO 64092 TaxID=2908842 RepID=UPI001FF29E82|nr:hypothetical protein [Muricauda sp. SCSIO 64092]UOY07746.1 hypothetical protein L0P88_04145 [Muricauda sp. SCSIO 64092]
MLTFEQLEKIGFEFYGRYEDEEIFYVDYQFVKDDSYFSICTTIDENNIFVEQTFELNDREIKKKFFTPYALQMVLFHLFDHPIANP